MKYAWLALVFLLSSGLVFADTTGFAKGSVWVSHTPATEGEVVLIHAALTNGSPQKLTGTVVFNDNDKAIGSIPFILDAGEARIVSLSWKALSGSHAISASITGASSAEAAGTETLNLTVAPKAIVAKQKTSDAEANAAAVVFSDSGSIQQTIGSVSPKAEEITAPVFESIDSLRKRAGVILGAQASATQAKVASLSEKKKALSAQDTPEAKSESRTTTVYQIIATVLLYIYEVLLFVVSKAGYFYPIFFFLILFILYKTYQRFTRPGFDY